MKFSVPTLVIISLVITCAFIEIVDAVSASPTTSPTQAPPGDLSPQPSAQSPTSLATAP
uniref:Uncharacterized protein n=1 Tax=Chenopodium quinoa TaxID=63459 RepID=A0A803M9N5_CHEQI